MRERGLKSTGSSDNRIIITVAPLAGAWIEIIADTAPLNWDSVAPLAGAWIEIAYGCGYTRPHTVAPLAGAWIEIGQAPASVPAPEVAPLAGAWIEISASGTAYITGGSSLPLRERGLKLSYPPWNLGCGMSLPLRERGLKSHGY